MPTTKIIDAETEPVTLAEAKAQCKVDGDEDDAFLTDLITAVRQAGENECCRTFIETTWELAADQFADALQLLWPRIMEVDWVKYLDTEGTLRMLDPADYVLDRDSEPGWLVPAYGVSWPSTRCQVNAVRVRYRAGYGSTAASVPAYIKRWMLLHIGHYHANREASVQGSIQPLPFAERLLDGARVYGG